MLLAKRRAGVFVVLWVIAALVILGGSAAGVYVYVASPSTTGSPLSTGGLSVASSNTAASSSASSGSSLDSRTTMVMTTPGGNESLQSSGSSTGNQTQEVLSLGESSSVYAIDGHQERKTFQADGLLWLFYSDGTDMYYMTNLNGSSATEVTTQPIGYHFSVWYDNSSDTVYYVSVNGENASFWYRWGTPEPNGTISWAIPEGVVNTNGTDGANPYIYASGGQVWVSLQTGGGTQVEVWFYNGTSWSSVDTIATPQGDMSILLPLGSAMALVYSAGGYYTSLHLGPVSVITTSDDGMTWSAPVMSQGNFSHLSAVAVGDTIYITGVNNESQVCFWTYTLGSPSMTAPEVMAQGSDYSTISTDGTSGLFLAYIVNGSVSYTYSTDLGSTWSNASQFIFSAATETGPAALPPLVTPYYFTNSTVFLAWLTGSGPYRVQVNVLSLG